MNLESIRTIKTLKYLELVDLEWDKRVGKSFVCKMKRVRKDPDLSIFLLERSNLKQSRELSRSIIQYGGDDKQSILKICFYTKVTYLFSDIKWGESY